MRHEQITSVNMHLLKSKPNNRYELVTFNSDPPPYAILSHTWQDGQEVSYQELRTDTGKHKSGYAKIRFCAERAAEDGLEYFWVDTCCIDKSSSAELTESINSMYKWYQQAQICYAYIEDWRPELDWADLASTASNEQSENASDDPVVETSTESELEDSEDWESIPESEFDDEGSCEPLSEAGYVTGADEAPQTQSRPLRWFTRGWTLQELIASKIVEFFDRDRKPRGMKSDPSVVHHLSRITGITQDVLSDVTGDRLRATCLGQRMSWAAYRQTTREEDTAYCLLGIFQVNMSLRYGEGSKAFLRLQEEILASSTDLSLLAWNQKDGETQTYRGIFSRHPIEFRNLSQCRLDDSEFSVENEIIMTNKGVRMETALFQFEESIRRSRPFLDFPCLSLGCTVNGDGIAAIWLRILNDVHVRKHACSLQAVLPSMRRSKEQRIYLARDFAASSSLDYERRLNVGIEVRLRPTDSYYLDVVDSWPRGHFDRITNKFVEGDRPGFVGFLFIHVNNIASANLKHRGGPIACFMAVFCRVEYSQLEVGLLNEIQATDFKTDIEAICTMESRAAREELGKKLQHLRENLDPVIGVHDKVTGAFLCIEIKILDGEYAIHVASGQVVEIDINDRRED